MMTIALEQELTHLMETCMNNNDGDKRANGRSNAAAMTLATTGQLDNNHSEQQIRFESHPCTNTMEIAILVSLLRPTGESYGPSCILHFSDNKDTEVICKLPV